MSGLIVFLGRIPVIVWILGGIAWGYSIHTDWEEFQWNPLLNQIQGAESKYKRIVQDNSEAQKFKEQREQKLRELNELAQKFKTTADEIPRSPSIPTLLKSLADISDDAGLTFAGFKPAAQLQEEFLVITPLDVTLKGTYPQIMSFLDAASNLTRVVAGNKLEMKNAVKRGNSAVVEATARLYTYHLAEGAGG